MKPDKAPQDNKVNLIKVEEGESREEFTKRAIKLFRKQGLLADKKEAQQKPELSEDTEGNDDE